MLGTPRALPILTASILAATALLCAQSLGGQTPAPALPQRPVFRAAAEVVDVDVVVVDKSGTPVRGLTREDFILLDRKKPQTIDTFDEIKTAAGATAPSFSALPASTRLDVATNADAESSRLVVVVLDDLHTYRGRNETVKTIARGLVDKLGPQSSMALLQTGGQNSVEVTSDRSRLLAAIETFKGRRAERRPIDACDPHFIKIKDDGSPTEQGCNQQDFDANMTMYKTLEDAARLLGGHDSRRRVFVLVSENFAKDLSGVFEVSSGRGNVVDSNGYATGGTDALAGGAPAANSQHDDAALNMMRSLRRNGVAAYSIDPRGEVKASDMMRECSPSFELPDPCEGTPDQPQDWSAWVRVSQHGLEYLSEAAGGFAVVNTNDFSGGIERIATELDNYYQLGFYPADTTTKGYRPIEVRLRDRPGLTLRFRRGYEIGGESDASPKADPLALLANGALPQAGLPMRLHAVSMPYSAKEARVAIALELTVPRQAIEGADQAMLDEIRYGIFAIDLKGAKVRQQTGSGARIALRPRPGLTEIPDRVTYQISATLQLPPGRYQLRAAATSTKLSEGGSTYLAVDVPDFDKGPISLTDLLLGYADGPHVPIARSEPRAAVPAANLLPFDPTLDRVFAASDTLRLYFKAVTSKPEAVTATVSALGPDGRVLLTFDKALPANAASLDTRLPLKQLGPGAYRLHVKVSDGAHTAERDIGFVVQ